jgi:hypothetical protein
LLATPNLGRLIYRTRATLAEDKQGDEAPASRDPSQIWPFDPRPVGRLRYKRWLCRRCRRCLVIQRRQTPTKMELEHIKIEIGLHPLILIRFLSTGPCPAWSMTGRGLVATRSNNDEARVRISARGLLARFPVSLAKVILMSNLSHALCFAGG